MGSAALPYLKNNPKVIFFTDFDGTITLTDSNDYMVLRPCPLKSLESNLSDRPTRLWP